MRVIFETPDKMYRITEHPDLDYDLDNLKGDCFNPEVCPDIPNLKAKELAFEALVEREGVFGYQLERWDATPGRGYETIDSCWGFVGMYTDSSDSHYIVDEMKNTIETLIADKTISRMVSYNERDSE